MYLRPNIKYRLSLAFLKSQSEKCFSIGFGTFIVLRNFFSQNYSTFSVIFFIYGMNVNATDFRKIIFTYFEIQMTFLLRNSKISVLPKVYLKICIFYL